MSARTNDPFAAYSDLEIQELERETVRELRRTQLFLGSLLEAAQRRRLHRKDGHTGLGGYAEMRGLGEREAWDYVHAVRAAALDPRVEPSVLSGEFPLRSAAVLDRALRLPPPPGTPPGEAPPDFVEIAKRNTTTDLMEQVSRYAGTR